MRCSIGMARTAEPAYSTTKPRPPATPSSAIRRSATSLALTWEPSLPSRRARQHDAELRRHHVGNALLRVVDVEKSYAVLARTLAHRPQKRGAGRIGVVIAAGLGGHGVVLHGESQIRP